MDIVKRNADKIRRTKQLEEVKKLRGANSFRNEPFDKSKVTARVSSFNLNYKVPDRKVSKSKSKSREKKPL